MRGAGEREKETLADLEGRRNRENEREKETEGSLRSSIGRFKDDHALSAILPSEPTNPPPLRLMETLRGSQTAWKQPLNFRAASFDWRRISLFVVQFARKRTDHIPVKIYRIY